MSQLRVMGKQPYIYGARCYIVREDDPECVLKEILPSGTAIWTHYWPWALECPSEAVAREIVGKLNYVEGVMYITRD